MRRLDDLKFHTADGGVYHVACYETANGHVVADAPPHKVLERADPARRYRTSDARRARDTELHGELGRSRDEDIPTGNPLPEDYSEYQGNRLPPQHGGWGKREAHAFDPVEDGDGDPDFDDNDLAQACDSRGYIDTRKWKVVQDRRGRLRLMRRVSDRRRRDSTAATRPIRVGDTRAETNMPRQLEALNARNAEFWRKRSGK